MYATFFSLHHNCRKKTVRCFGLWNCDSVCGMHNGIIKLSRWVRRKFWYWQWKITVVFCAVFIQTCHSSRGVENPRALRTVKCYVIEARRSPNERFRSTPYPIDASVFMYWYRWYEHRFRLFTSSLIQFLEYYLIYTQLSATPPIVKTKKARQIRWWQSNCVWFREWINFILLNEISQYSIAVTFWHTSVRFKNVLHASPIEVFHERVRVHAFSCIQKQFSV